MFCKHGLICITGLKFDIQVLAAFNGAQKFPGGALPYKSYIGMYGAKGYGFCAFLG